MRLVYLNIAKAKLVGFLITLPFAILEFMTGKPEAPRSGFPIAVFIYLFVVASFFFLAFFSILRTVREGTVRPHLVTFGAKILVALVCVWSWTTLVLDQLPCFLGATGC